MNYGYTSKFLPALIFQTSMIVSEEEVALEILLQPVVTLVTQQAGRASVEIVRKGRLERESHLFSWGSTVAGSISILSYWEILGGEITVTGNGLFPLEPGGQIVEEDWMISCLRCISNVLLSLLPELHDL